MNSSRFLYLPIEGIARELDSKILLALAASCRGYSVIIGTKTINRFLSSCPPGIYMYKDSSKPSKDIFIPIIQSGHKVVVHDEEGLVHQSDEDYLQRRVTFETLHYVDLYLCWGASQRSLIEKAKQHLNAQTHTASVGHPRFDLLREPFKLYNSVLGEKISGRVVLINTKLSECNHKNGPSGWLDLLKSHGMLHGQEGLNFRLAQIEYKRMLLSKYIELVEAIVCGAPDVTVVFRPHPSEDINFWKNTFIGLPNVMVTADENIGYWLHRSNVVVHTGCTTGIEACVMGLPVIAFCPFGQNQFDCKLPNSISSEVQSVSDCVSLISSILNQDIKGYIPPVLKSHIENLDGEFAYTNILDALDNVAAPKGKFSLWLRLKLKVEYCLLLCLSFIRHKVLRKSVSSKPIIDKSDLLDKVKRLSVMLNTEMPTIKVITKNAYIIEPLKKKH